jgi:hypothetical protein
MLDLRQVVSISLLPVNGLWKLSDPLLVDGRRLLRYDN